MSTIAFDTLKLAQRLEAAGLPAKQAQEMATALGDTIGDAVVTRDFLDLRLGEMNTRLDGTIAGLDHRLDEMRMTMATKVEVAEAKNDVLKWMFGAVGLQTVAILGGVAALLRLLH